MNIRGGQKHTKLHVVEMTEYCLSLLKNITERILLTFKKKYHVTEINENTLIIQNDGRHKTTSKTSRKQSRP